MTATDWLEVAAANLSNSLAAFAITVTIASGYLIMAYMVGKKLTTPQQWILNSLFTIIMTLVAFGDFESLSTTVRARREAIALLPHWQEILAESATTSVFSSLSLNLLLIIACLKFMWDIRHAEE